MLARRRPATRAPDGARRRRYRWGMTAEALATLALRLKGYRVLARRHRTPAGEIDIIAVRRGRLAFIEVKARATRADCEAAITVRQSRRMHRAALLWLARQPTYVEYEMGFDLVFVLPWRWPLHIENGL